MFPFQHFQYGVQHNFGMEVIDFEKNRIRDNKSGGKNKVRVKWCKYVKISYGVQSSKIKQPES